MMRVRTIFFDAGGTLVHPKEDVGEVYARTAAAYGLSAEPQAVMHAFLDAFHAQKLDGRPQDRAWWREVVDRTFATFGRARDPGALFDDLYEHFTSPSSWVLYPQARHTVEVLCTRGYQVGLISNWDDRLPLLLEGLEIKALLDPIVVSYRVGVEKPHPEIFQTALREAEAAPSESLMVGDDYEADVRGATALGMQAVLVRRPGQRPNGARVIESLSELLGLLPGPTHG